MHAFPGREQEQCYLAGRLQSLLGEKDATKAVFFRTNSGMQNYAVYLRRKNIPCRMREQSRSVYEHFIVQDIMAYLLLAEQSGKRAELEPLLRILNKPCRYINREDAGKVKEILEQSAQKASDIPAAGKLAGQLSAMHGMKLPMAVTYVLKAVGYEKYLRQLSLGKPDRWQEWQEMLAWLKNDAANFSSASEWQAMQKAYGEELEMSWKSRKKEAGTEEQDAETNVIQLMTVHASKGLEFDHVLIPDCNEGSFPYGRMPDEETVEEERRVFYVAMTRAKDSLELLYLTGTKNSPRLPSRFLNPLLDTQKKSD
jgi:DNA helicase-2/ATP-dependent DNA helicase PcrA